MAVRTIACLPAIIGSWRHPGGGRLALHERHLRLRDGPAHPPRPLAARHAHRQHEPAGRGPRRRAGRPAGPGPLRLQLQPGRRRPEPDEGARGAAGATTCSRSSTSCSPPIPSITPTSCCPATSQLEHVDIHGSYGHHDVMYNPRRSLRGASAGRTTTSFATWPRGMGFEPELFPDDETLIREVLDGGPTVEGITLERLEAEGSVRLNIPEDLRPVRRGRLPHAVGQVRALLRADEGRRSRPAADLHPAARRSANPPDAGRASIRCSSSARRARSSSTRRSPTRHATAPQPASRRSSCRPRTPSRAA